MQLVQLLQELHLGAQEHESIEQAGQQDCAGQAVGQHDLTIGNDEQGQGFEQGQAAND